MTYAARVDANQAQIVMALRSVGASVQPLHTVGRGCPDLLVGFRGRCYVFEVKQPGLPPSKRLTDEEEKWHKNWRGQIGIVETPQQAVEMLQSLARLAA